MAENLQEPQDESLEGFTETMLGGDQVVRKEPEGRSLKIRNWLGKYQVPAAILFGAILVAGSVFYSASLIEKRLNKLEARQASVEGVLTSVNAENNNGQTARVQVADRQGEAHLGDPEAKVTMVEFADFQCPYCQAFFQQTFERIKTEYIDTGKVRYLFRQFPLTNLHVNAKISAVASECAGQQGKFWEFHNLLYTFGQSDGTNLDEQSLRKYAGQLGLNMSVFNECLADKATAQIVADDQAEGVKDGVSGTPTFFINGKMIVGAQPFAVFQQAIDQELN